MTRDRTARVRAIARGWILVLLLGVRQAAAVDLYETDFASFPVGSNQWAGTDGWVSPDNTSGVHGIDDNILPGLGKSGYLGYYPPPGTFTTIFRPVIYDPVSNNTPVVRFESLMGIEDSTNGRGDSFFFTVYNLSGEFLAAIRFSNNPLSFGIWRDDGVTEQHTGLDFIPGELHLLFFEIDFGANTWSADLDGIPLFTNAVFNASGKALSLYTVAAEWALTSANPAFYGDNWLLVADWRLWAMPSGSASVRIDRFVLDEAGLPELAWLGEPGFTYAVYFTEDYVNWWTNAGQSVFGNLATSQTLTYADADYTNGLFRVYRVRRTVTP